MEYCTEYNPLFVVGFHHAHLIQFQFSVSANVRSWIYAKLYVIKMMKSDVVLMKGYKDNAISCKSVTLGSLYSYGVISFTLYAHNNVPEYLTKVYV